MRVMASWQHDTRESTDVDQESPDGLLHSLRRSAPALDAPPGRVVAE